MEPARDSSMESSGTLCLKLHILPTMLAQVICLKCWVKIQHHILMMEEPLESTEWAKRGVWPPAMRIKTAPPKLGSGSAKFGDEDVFILSEFCCKRDDSAILRDLLQELPEGTEFESWRGGRHNVL